MTIFQVIQAEFWVKVLIGNNHISVEFHWLWNCFCTRNSTQSISPIPYLPHIPAEPLPSPATFHHPHPKKCNKVYLLWSLRVPCPGKGSHGVQQWPCGNHEKVDTACCGVGALKASGSYPVGQPQCSQASSSSHHNLSSHTQSIKATRMRSTKWPSNSPEAKKK